MLCGGSAAGAGRSGPCLLPTNAKDLGGSRASLSPPVEKLMFLLNQPLPSRLGPSLGALLLWEGWGCCQEAAEEAAYVAHPQADPLLWCVVHGDLLWPLLSLRQGSGGQGSGEQGPGILGALGIEWVGGNQATKRWSMKLRGCVQSSIRVAKESWGFLSSDCRANRPHLGLCPEARVPLQGR